MSLGDSGQVWRFWSSLDGSDQVWAMLIKVLGSNLVTLGPPRFASAVHEAAPRTDVRQKPAYVKAYW